MIPSNLASRLAKFGLDDEAQQEYAQSVREDEEMDTEEKLGIFTELIPEGSTSTPNSLKDDLLVLIKDVDDLRKTLVENQMKAEAERRAQQISTVDNAQRPFSPSRDTSEKIAPTKTLSLEEKAKRDLLLREYGDLTEEFIRPEDSEITDETILVSAKKGNPRVRSNENPSSDPILVRNMNSAAIHAKEQEKRAKLAKSSAAKKEKDRADLAKQRADQAKRKEEARQKASRGERKA